MYVCTYVVSIKLLYVRTLICRAVYGEADLYLLDDPLSAVDPQVEHHLYEECIRKLLKNSAVVLVTHQLPIAQLSDNVMVMKEVRGDLFVTLLFSESVLVLHDHSMSSSQTIT